MACFFILFKYGGLYADLDIFPNLEKFPLVPLGLCKMEARNNAKPIHKHNWEVELVVATEGNQLIIEILEAMLLAMSRVSQSHCYS